VLERVLAPVQELVQVRALELESSFRPSALVEWLWLSWWMCRNRSRTT